MRWEYHRDHVNPESQLVVVEIRFATESLGSRGYLFAIGFLGSRGSTSLPASVKDTVASIQTEYCNQVVR